MKSIWIGLALMLGLAFTAQAQERFITLASTTSTDNSGLLAELLPAFTTASGIAVRVVAVGTGQAIRLARNGDADVLLVHHRASEDALVADGFGVERHDVMYNDFVLIGPEADPARVRGEPDVAKALARIAGAAAPFASRGDESGTHAKERALWREAGVDPAGASGTWYRETGSGMGATLNTASAMGAYVLADRATWLRFANKGELAIAVEGDSRLHNPYGVIAVSPDKHPHIKWADAERFVAWLRSRDGQSRIAAFRIAGQQAFFPSATSGGW